MSEDLLSLSFGLQKRGAQVERTKAAACLSGVVVVVVVSLDTYDVIHKDTQAQLPVKCV